MAIKLNAISGLFSPSMHDTQSDLFENELLITPGSAISHEENHDACIGVLCGGRYFNDLVFGDSVERIGR